MQNGMGSEFICRGFQSFIITKDRNNFLINFYSTKKNDRYKRSSRFRLRIMKRIVRSVNTRLVISGPVVHNRDQSGVEWGTGAEGGEGVAACTLFIVKLKTLIKTNNG